jgi:nickel-dependent lactate racemase
MRTTILYGRSALECEVGSRRWVELHRHVVPTPLTDPAAAVRAALESPDGYPALRRSLTPDDHVVVLVDEALPRLAVLLTPVLEHIVGAGVAAEAITLLCPPSASRQGWIEDLPEQYEEARLEVHDPTDRKHLSYLATTKQGKRVYLNRSAVDADQLVILSGRRYDPLLGVGGCEGALYPGVSDEATIHEGGNHLSLAVPGTEAWPVRREAAEVSWLLGAPFVVQIIEGEGDEIAHVVAGPVSSSAEGQRLLDSSWHMRIPASVDTVVAAVSGDPGRCGFAEMAAALSCAARIVRSGGRIILLTEGVPSLGEGAAILRQADEPQQALTMLVERNPPDRAAGLQWATAAAQARLYILSGLPAETVEEMFATPLENASQVQRLLQDEGTILLLQDAHKAVVEVEETKVERSHAKVRSNR